jgi:hypothetical protein
VQRRGARPWIACAVLWPAVARADGAGAAASGEEVVVVRGSEAGGFSSQARLENEPREVTDAAGLLEPMPGVHIRRLGGDDAFATLSIRGSSSTQVVVVLAGVPLTGGADPTLDLSSLPLWPGMGARVYRTFAPASLGPGSLGGTLVLEPPRVGSGAHTEVWDAVGSFGESRLRVGDVRDVGGGVRVLTALSASRATDDFSYYDPTHDDTTTRVNNGHARVNGLAAVAIPVPWIGAQGTLTVTTLTQASRQELAGTIERPTPFASLTSNRELGVVELSRGSERGAEYARVFGRRDDLRLLDKAPTADGGPTHTNDGIFALGGAFGWRGRLASSVHLDARADATGERFEPGTYVDAIQPAPASRASAGGGADLEWRPSRGATLAASGRLDGWTDRSDGSAAHSEFHPTGHVGGELALGPVSVSAHAGALARPPSFTELYGNRGGILGNPNLASESALAADVGARAAKQKGPLGVSFEVAGFATWATDLITFLANGAYGALKATNIGRARIFGAESELLARAYGFRLRAAYTALLTLDDSECAGTAGCSAPPLPGRPAHDLVADLTYGVGPLAVRYGVDVVSGIRADEAGLILVPARVLQGAGVHVDVPRMPGLRLGVEVRNLFDVRTASYAGVLGPVQAPIGDLYDYPLPGRSVLFTALWRTGPNATR